MSMKDANSFPTTKLLSQKTESFSCLKILNSLYKLAFKLLNYRDFIKGRALGKLTGCEDDFALLV